MFVKVCQNSVTVRYQSLSVIDRYEWDATWNGYDIHVAAYYTIEGVHVDMYTFDNGDDEVKAIATTTKYGERFVYGQADSLLSEYLQRGAQPDPALQR